MLIIPTQAVPNQTVNVILGDQITTLNIYQKSFGLFINVYLGASLVIGGVLCENLNRIVRDAYLGFSGDLAFIDNEGADDPVYTGLGSRFSLAYIEPAEAAVISAREG